MYARQINEPRDLGKNVMVRDAYLFAAPILCDVDSVNGVYACANNATYELLMMRINISV